MADNRPSMKCSKCGKEKFNTRLCGYFSLEKRIICKDCCELIQKAGSCKIKDCPYKKH